jgi:dipeptidyl aminopeptidase/acylaminoacyl peptidase
MIARVARFRSEGVWEAVLIILSALLVLPGVTHAPVDAQEVTSQQVLQQETFVSPPDEIAEAVLAPRYLNLSLTDLSPDKLWFLNEIGDGPVTMDVFSKPFHELGGRFIDFAANRDRRLTIRNNVGIRLTSAVDGSTVDVDVPPDARVSNAKWSPDGSRLAYFAHFEDATHIYVADPASGDSRRVTRRPVLATEYTDYDWSEDGSRVATVLVPDDRPRMPVEPSVPLGPQVKLTEDGENRLRTYASLMETPYDQALLEWHLTGQVAVIEVANRETDEIGQATAVRDLDLSPDGEFVRVRRVVEPYSYIVPVGNFASVEEIWDRSGAVLAIIEEDSLDTGIRDPDRQQGGGLFGEENEGKREIAWRWDGGGLTYLEREPESEDGADARDEAETDDERADRKDRVMQWLPPFDEGSVRVVYESENRLSDHRFSSDMSILFLVERRGERVHEYAVYLNDPDTTYTLARYESEDVYANPGSLLPARGPLPSGGGFARFRQRADATIPVELSQDGTHVFYVGIDYDEDPLEVAPRGFLDRVTIRTGESERIFEGSNDGVFERVSAVIDADESRLVVSRESPTDVPQAYLRSGGNDVQLTQNRDYTPDLTNAPRERFVVKRPDGFRFLVNVTLPPGHQVGDGPLPAMFWFYPREYEDQESYDEGARTFNKNAFPDFGTRSMEYLVRLGYAVVEPDAPIVGPEGRMNDNYEHDLRNNLAAVIDELDRRGIVDRRRLGIGGHSYGAFSTANAMVHTPFFKAGIAGDGNFNRTFTPLSFQRERRILWEAKDVYLSMSPFLYANNMTGALLIYHGLHDQNVGTAPEHAPRMFHALNGLGKTAAMYLYPFEDHGPATKETLLDLWARWSAWLDVHVKSTGDQANTVMDQDGNGSS